MRANISVKIPCNAASAYTLYAHGYKIEVPYLDEKEEYYHFTFQHGTVLVLFYHFTDFRRAFVVTTWDDKMQVDGIMLPGVNEKLCLIYEAKGRRFDILKRTIYNLTKDDEFSIFKYDLSFWYRLCFLIQSCQGKSSDIKLLCDKYKLEHDYAGRRITKNHLCTKEITRIG